MKRMLVTYEKDTLAIHDTKNVSEDMILVSKTDVEVLVRQAYNEGSYLKLFGRGWDHMQDRINLLFGDK